MKGPDLYLERYGWPGPLIKEIPEKDLEMLVVIPVFNEPDVIKSLQALNDCNQPGCVVEVLAIINHPEDAEPSVKKGSEETFKQIKAWSDTNGHSRMKFYTVLVGGLKKKFAGPGLARKIGMDEAVRRLYRIGKPNGLIVSYDADCTCDKNYLVEVFKLYKTKKDFKGCAVYYEHTPERRGENLSGDIINYELHLRYYSNALEYAGYPYPYHTIGSTMVVTAQAYIASGGMNRRKAGEDFFFLQKIFPAGGFYYLNTTTVYPSSRISDRVPFGTGAAMLKLSKVAAPEYLTYNIKTFIGLREFLALRGQWFDADDSAISDWLERLSPGIKTWLKKNDFRDHLKRIRKNSASKHTFHKAFFQWFTRFQVLKYVHFSRDCFYHNVEVVKALNELMKQCEPSWRTIDDRAELLVAVRRHDRGKGRSESVEPVKPF